MTQYNFQGVDWALVIPMANEERDFDSFTSVLQTALFYLKSGIVYLVVDNASKDKTLEKCRKLSSIDPRFITVFSPESRCVVDAYLTGYKAALKNNHEYIIEMDAGLSHDPMILGNFIKYLTEGIPCVFGSRFVKGGSMGDSPLKRRLLSKSGTILSNLLLGTKLKDMTSGYQGFSKEIVFKFLNHPIKSKAHFYQTELRYLLRNFNFMEIPINYRAPSPSVSLKALKNSLETLLFYFFNRIKGKNIFIE